MDAVDKVKRRGREGRVGVAGVMDRIAALRRQLQAANKRTAELEKQVGGAATTKVAEPYSMRAEEKRQQARQPKKKRKRGRRGRLTSADKLKLAQRTETCYPEGVPPQDCQRSHTRPLWRLENGRADLIAYEICS